MSFLKKPLIVLAAVSLLFSSALCFAGFMDSLNSYGKLAQQVLADQTLTDLQNGVLNLSDNTLNEMLAMTVGGDANNSVQSVNVEFLNDNKLRITTKTKEVSYLVEAKIITFVHNKNVSEATLEVDKMRILDGGIINGFKNIILSMCNVQTLFSWFGVPQFENGLKVSAKGNMVYVDFHEWIYKTKFGSMMFIGKGVLDIFNVQKVETTEHNMKIYVALAI